MAYIKERGNNNFFVRVSCGTLDNGRPFQKSRLFRPSRVNLPESKVRKELDAFVKALEEECRIEFETKRQPQTNFELSKGSAGIYDNDFCGHSFTRCLLCRRLLPPTAWRS